MKLNKYIYVLSMAGMLGLWSCTSDEAMPDSNVASGERVPITIEVSHGGDVQTRTDLSEDLQEGGLTHTWAAGDEVVFYNSNGQEAGKLTLQEGEGTSKGIFTGTVTAESGKYHLWYFGRPQAAADASSADRYPYLDFSEAGKVKLNFANQNFKSVDDLTAVDVLSTDVNVMVSGDKASVTRSVVMEPKVAMARFTLSGLPNKDTGTVKIFNKSEINNSKIYIKSQFNLNDGVGSGNKEEASCFTFDNVKYVDNSENTENAKHNNDLFVAFIPGDDYVLHFEFKSNEGPRYVHTFGSNDIHAGVYYQTFNKVEDSENGKAEGIDVPFDTDAYDTGSWGSADNDIDPVAIREDMVWQSDYDGWTTNTASLRSYGGFATFIKYEHNGMIDGHLTSQGETSLWYQWGRWLGLPLECAYLAIGTYGSYSGDLNYWSQVPLGIQYVNDINIGYSFANHLSAGHGQVYMGANNTWTAERALRCSIMFGRINTTFSNTHHDYVYKNEDNTWIGRCGSSPAPDNYRIPTARELYALFPENGNKADGTQIRIDGNKVEYKGDGANRYAIRWKVIAATSDNSPMLEVNSFKTTDNNVSADDSRFDQANTVRFYGLGLLKPEGNILGTGPNKGGYTSIYWSSETGIRDSENAGKGIQIIWDGSSVIIHYNSFYRGYGAMVQLIKDENMRTQPLKPWFPICGDFNGSIKNYPHSV